MDYYYEFKSYFHEPNSEFKRDMMILLYEQQIEHFTQLYYKSNYIIERNKKSEKVIPISNFKYTR